MQKQSKLKAQATTLRYCRHHTSWVLFAEPLSLKSTGHISKWHTAARSSTRAQATQLIDKAGHWKVQATLWELEGHLYNTQGNLSSGQESSKLRTGSTRDSQGRFLICTCPLHSPGNAPGGERGNFSKRTYSLRPTKHRSPEGKSSEAAGSLLPNFPG